MGQRNAQDGAGTTVSGALATAWSNIARTGRRSRVTLGGVMQKVIDQAPLSILLHIHNRRRLVGRRHLPVRRQLKDRIRHCAQSLCTPSSGGGDGARNFPRFAHLASS
jgi:hypothetical protein